MMDKKTIINKIQALGLTCDIKTEQGVRHFYNGHEYVEIGGISMNITKETTDWGIIYYYKNDCCRFALHAFNDDENTMYLSNVKVEQSARGRGIGNKILELADKEAKKYNYAVICLKVLKSSWVHNWYANHGYRDFCYDGEDAKYVWMKHTLYNYLKFLLKIC